MDYADNYYNVSSLADRIRGAAKEGRTTSMGLGSRGAVAQRHSDDIDTLRARYINESRDFFSLLKADISKEEELAGLAQETEDYLGMIGAIPTEGDNSRPRKNPKFFAEDLQTGNMSERELLALTLQAEAGGEGKVGMLAAGAVIDNRVKTAGYGDTFTEVILAPGQFSAWNSLTGYAKGEGGLDMSTIRPSKMALEVADMILSGAYESPVGNATHYYNPADADPPWGKKAGGDWQTIGNHVFGFGN
jgi:spore germination cell wall hydrolase CwlJ-like protein